MTREELFGKENPFFDIDICCLNAEEDGLVILDQTLLPNEERFETLHTAEEVAEAIALLKVRGAPAIGIAAALGLYASISRIDESCSEEEFGARMNRNLVIIQNSRPTAVNLSWALGRMHEVWVKSRSLPVKEIKSLLKEEALRIKLEDIECCELIGNHGATLIRDGMGILTHCNAGHLATGRYGTALSPIYVAHQQGKKIRVFSDETRPLLQGARLTCYELMHSGIDTTLICDNMAAEVMKRGWVDCIFVGCDRVAANGDTANKIGTSALAIVAHHYGIPFYVCGPSSTFDLNCKTGRDIVIEERRGEEIGEMWYEKPMSPKGVKFFNPSFDVTDHSLITGFVTEKGIVKL